MIPGTFIPTPAAVAAPLALTFLSALNDGTDVTSGNTYTFSSVSLGAAVADRVIIVTLNMEQVTLVTSVTIGGVAATRIASQTDGTGANDRKAEIWAAEVPSGTSGNIVVTVGTDQSGMCGGVFRKVGGVGGTAASDTATDSGAAGSLSAAITIPAGGAAVATMFVGTSASYTWTGATESYDEFVSGTGSGSGAIATSSGTVTGTNAGSDGGALVIAAWA